MPSLPQKRLYTPVLAAAVVATVAVAAAAYYFMSKRTDEDSKGEEDEEESEESPEGTEASGGAVTKARLIAVLKDMSDNLQNFEVR